MTTRPLNTREAWLVRSFLHFARRLRLGTLQVVTPDGITREVRGTEAGPMGTLVLVKPAPAIRRILTGGAMGLGQGYLAGEWDSPDLMSLLELGQRNAQALEDERSFWIRLSLIPSNIVHAFRSNTRRQAQRNIHYHYDLGNDFYKLWLDESLTYSCAIFPRPDATLFEAQQEKYRLILDQLQLSPEHHLLEIGSGWGGFALYAAQMSGCHVTSITLSRAQLETARARAREAQLTDRVRFELCDYRDVTGQFDRLVSIEMFEAVGERYWPIFFDTVAARMKTGGRAVMQVITIRNEAFEHYRTQADFIQRYVFPGGMLPSPGRWDEEAHQAGLSSAARKFYGSHYAQTLKIWDGRVRAAHPGILALGFDERFLRLWHYYLAYCHAGFTTAHIDLMQDTLIHRAS